MIKNKTFLITGHTSGLGKALNIELLKSKNKIIGISKSRSNLKNLIDIEVDFLNFIKLKKKLNRIKKLKKIDYIILNAGLLGDLENLSKIDIKKFQNILNVNFLSNKIIIDYLLSSKIKIKNIISISSGAALKAKYAWGPYCVSKAATKMMMDVYSLENNKINFINLAPGLIKTKMQKQIFYTKKKYSSLKKFKYLYKNNLIDSPEIVAKKLINFLPKIKKSDIALYIDLRNE